MDIPKGIDNIKKEEPPDGYVHMNNPLTAELIFNVCNQIGVLTNSLNQVNNYISNIDKSNKQLITITQQLTSQNQLHADHIKKLSFYLHGISSGMPNYPNQMPPRNPNDMNQHWSQNQNPGYN